MTRSGAGLLTPAASSVSAVLSRALKPVLFSPKCYNAQFLKTTGPPANPQWPGAPPDRGESAVSTHASLAERGIPDFLDVLCHCLGGSQVLLMISILE